jgi:shikimate dehydrogenase
MVPNRGQVVSARNDTTAGTRRWLLGLIGSGILQSRSPALHQGAADDLGGMAIYRLLDLEALGLGMEALAELLVNAERFGFAGLNITFPCKQAVIPHLGALSPEAEALGAVNTVVFRDGRRIGHNTDWFGYAEALRRELPKADLTHVVQFGAGGAGSAVAYALLTLGVKRLSVIDTDENRSGDLVRLLSPRFGESRIGIPSTARQAVAEATGLVNTTPVGMAKFPGTPFPVDWLAPHHWVSDIIYFPIETTLLRAARDLGCRTIDGSGMNVFQAAEAFRLFTGHAPDIARLRHHFEQAGVIR